MGELKRRVSLLIAFNLNSWQLLAIKYRFRASAGVVLTLRPFSDLPEDPHPGVLLRSSAALRSARRFFLGVELVIPWARQVVTIFTRLRDQL